MSANEAAFSLLFSIYISLFSISSNNILNDSFLIIMNIDDMNQLINLPIHIIT